MFPHRGRNVRRPGFPAAADFGEMGKEESAKLLGDFPSFAAIVRNFTTLNERLRTES